MIRLTSPDLSIFYRNLFSPLIFIYLLMMWIPSQVQGQDNEVLSVIQDKTKLEFEEKLRYYLNQKTQQVVDELLAREIQILQMVQLINDEISKRGKDSLVNDKSGFELIHGESDSLATEYSKELDTILGIYNDLQRLQQVAEYDGDLQSFNELLDLKVNVTSSLENRELYKKSVYTPTKIGAVIDEYTEEVDSLLGIYDTLEWLKVQAVDSNDEKALSMIEEQKSNLIKVLSQWDKLGPLSPDDFDMFRNETQNVQRVVRDADEAAKLHSTDVSAKILSMKESLLNRLDKTLYDYLSDSGYSLPENPSVTDVVDAWKAERISDVKTKLSEYEIIRKNLIKNGLQFQTQRMIAQEINFALFNYVDGRYRVAEYQLMDILDSYQGNYTFFTPLRYYLAECRYNRMAYESAREAYQTILTDSVATPYHTEALIRMMQLENMTGSSQKLLTYYDQIVNLDTLATEGVLSYAHYIAANKYFDRSQYTKARDILIKVPEKTQFYLPAQLLLGVVYTNLNDYDKAIPVFRDLTTRKNYPWTDLNVAHIRNTAMIRLGMIYYQRGSYALANSMFSEVSRGSEDYDAALIGQAWTNYNLGNPDASLERAHSLLKNYLSSNYTYEALSLSAHCKQLLQQPESALNSYRYVVRAHGVLETRKNFDKEREQVLGQVQQLNKMEQDALERRQTELYSEIESIKIDLNEFLLRIKEKSDTGSLLIQDYYDERKNIVDRLFELDSIIAWAHEQGRSDIAEKAVSQRVRLVKVLETYRADKDVTNTAYLVDFPLAAKEASMHYQRENMATIFRELDVEKQRIERNLNQAQNVKIQKESGKSISVQTDIEMVESDLSNLRDQLSRFKAWMVENRPGEPQSNMEYWRDVSGLGMSDVVYDLRNKKLGEIDFYADRLNTIESLLNRRRSEIEQKLKVFEQDIRRIHDSLLSRKIQLEQLEKQTYFDNLYFDTKENEEETWEEKLNLLINP